MKNISLKKSSSDKKAYLKNKKESALTLDIAQALKEVKLMREGKIKPLTLNDI